MNDTRLEIEPLLAKTSKRVGVSLHGLAGERDSRKSLEKIEPIVKENLADPDFTGEHIGHLEEWLEDDPKGKKSALLTTYLDYSLEAYRVLEQSDSLTEAHFGVPGHDMENVVHTVSSVLEMVDRADGKLGNYATWELLISGLNENLGRTIEGDDYTHQTTGFLLARQAIRVVGAEDTELQDEGELGLIAKRVLGNVYDHGGKNVGDPISDLVRQSNRMQMCEPRFLRRSLEYDVAQVGQDIISPIDPKRQTDISVTFQPNATLMDWGEFYARNLFSFESGLNDANPEFYKRIMNENQKIANDRRANSVVMLTILAGGENTELYRQVFAPELDLVKETHRFKRRIPEGIFQTGREKYHAFVKKLPEFPELEGLDDKQQIAKVLRATSSFVPDELLEKVYAKYDELQPDQQQNLLQALRFSLMLYDQELDEELKLAGKLSESPNQHVVKLANFVKNYLETKKG